MPTADSLTVFALAVFLAARTETCSELLVIVFSRASEETKVLLGPLKKKKVQCVL